MAEKVEKRSKKSKVKKVIFITALVLVILIVASLILIPIIVMPNMFLGQRYNQEQFYSEDFGISSEQITLTTEDSLSLAAWRTRADNAKGTVIILSGIQNPSVTAFFGYAKMLADNGWDSLLIEMRARSKSEGDEIGLGITEWLDVKAGVDFLSADEQIKDLPIVAMGTSMGAGTVIIAAGELEQIDGVISISAFSSWAELFSDNMTMMGIPKFIGVLDRPFINMYVGFYFGFEYLKYSPIKEIDKITDRPILMMHSTADTQVPYSEFERLLKKANLNELDVTTFIREGDEHFVCYEKYFSEPTQDVEFSKTILDFLDSNFN